MFTHPDVIWSGVLAAALAFGGVILSNWINSKNIKRQLEHDALERDRERKASLRKEVYLPAAEELTKAQSYLSTLPQADLTDRERASGLNGFYAAAAKLQLVCEPDTSLLVGDLIAAISGLFFRLLAKVDPMHSLRSDIAIRSHHITRYQGEIDRVLSEMAELTESGDPKPDRMKALSHSFEFYQKQSNRISAERNEMFRRQNEMNAAYARDLIIELKPLLPIQMKVMAAIRAELNLGTDLDHANRQMVAQLKQMTAHMDALLNQLAPKEP
jgi:hypothetical protein